MALAAVGRDAERRARATVSVSKENSWRSLSAAAVAPPEIPPKTSMPSVPDESSGTTVAVCDARSAGAASPDALYATASHRGAASSLAPRRSTAMSFIRARSLSSPPKRYASRWPTSTIDAPYRAAGASPSAGRLDHAPVCTLSDHRSLRATIDASRPPNSHAYRPSDEVSEPKECCNTDAASARDGGSFEVSCSVKTTYCSLAAINGDSKAAMKTMGVFMANNRSLKRCVARAFSNFQRA